MLHSPGKAIVWDHVVIWNASCVSNLLLCVYHILSQSYGILFNWNKGWLHIAYSIFKIESVSIRWTCVLLQVERRTMWTGWLTQWWAGLQRQMGVSWATRKRIGGWGGCPSAGMVGTTLSSGNRHLVHVLWRITCGVWAVFPGFYWIIIIIIMMVMMMIMVKKKRIIIIINNWPVIVGH